MINWLIYWLKDIDVLVTNNKSNIRKKSEYIYNTPVSHLLYSNYK